MENKFKTKFFLTQLTFVSIGLTFFSLVGCGKNPKQLKINIQRTCKTCNVLGIDINEANYIPIESINSQNFTDKYKIGEKIKVDIIAEDFSIIESGETIIDENAFSVGQITINTQ